MQVCSHAAHERSRTRRILSDSPTGPTGRVPYFQHCLSVIKLDDRVGDQDNHESRTATTGQTVFGAVLMGEHGWQFAISPSIAI